jgi:hypothetical protein
MIIKTQKESRKNKNGNIPFSRFYFRGSARRGQAALSLVFLIGGIALLVAVTLSLVAINFLNSTFAFRSANQAMNMAAGGAEDALLRLNRNPAFSSEGYFIPSLCVLSACTTVTVTQNSPSSGQATIVSTATVSYSQRKIQVVVSIDQNTGQINIVSWAAQTI